VVAGHFSGTKKSSRRLEPGQNRKQLRALTFFLSVAVEPVETPVEARFLLLRQGVMKAGAAVEAAFVLSLDTLYPLRFRSQLVPVAQLDRPQRGVLVVEERPEEVHPSAHFLPQSLLQHFKSVAVEPVETQAGHHPVLGTELVETLLLTVAVVVARLVRASHLVQGQYRHQVLVARTGTTVLLSPVIQARLLPRSPSVDRVVVLEALLVTVRQQHESTAVWAF